MRLTGHVGAALGAYAPIAYLTLRLGAIRLAVVGAVVAIALASLPDADRHLPALAHRGATHTVWFAMGIGAACAAAFALAGPWLGSAAFVARLDGTPPGGGLAAFGFAVGTAAILSHLAVDLLTPMGVAPFGPLGRRYSLGVTTSASRAANRWALAVGMGLAALAFGLGGTPVPV